MDEYEFEQDRLNKLIKIKEYLNEIMKMIKMLGGASGFKHIYGPNAIDLINMLIKLNNNYDKLNYQSYSHLIDYENNLIKIKEITSKFVEILKLYNNKIDEGTFINFHII